MSGRIIDGELAELTAQRNEQNRIIAELRTESVAQGQTNDALMALYADALVTIAQLRAEYEPRPAPGAAQTPLADVTDLAVLKDVAVRKIVALQVDLAEQKRRAEAADGHSKACLKSANSINDELIAERAAHAATTAKLARAVALIKRIGEYGKAWVDAMSETSKVQAKRGAEGVRAFEAEVDAILADADSAAAGEAWQATKMVVQAARRHRDTDAVLDAFYVRLDAVDARRGGK